MPLLACQSARMLSGPIDVTKPRLQKDEDLTRKREDTRE